MQRIIRDHRKTKRGIPGHFLIKRAEACVCFALPDMETLWTHLYFVVVTAVCVCVRVRACVRACVRVCVYVCSLFN